MFFASSSIKICLRIWSTPEYYYSSPDINRDSFLLPRVNSPVAVVHCVYNNSRSSCSFLYLAGEQNILPPSVIYFIVRWKNNKFEKYYYSSLSFSLYLSVGLGLLLYNVRTERARGSAPTNIFVSPCNK